MYKLDVKKEFKNIQTINYRLLSLLIFAFSSFSNIEATNGPRFEWICTNDTSLCQKINNDHNTYSDTFSTVELCRLVCGKDGAVWPKPFSFEITDKSLITFNPEQIDIRFFPTPSELGKNVEKTFKSNLRNEYENCESYKEVKFTIIINTYSNSEELSWNTNERYSLKVKTKNDDIYVVINAQNIFGARHGLETLSQLMASHPEPNNSTCMAMVKGVDIDDKPAYTHRGLLLDTSRNFQSIETIKKHIQAMASSKMNVLHWHISDSHSFPMETPSVPNMTLYGAYSPKHVYKYSDLQELIKYALCRGVRILFELDGPSHAGSGWQWGPEAGLGNLTVCFQHQPWRKACIQPPCGQLNPSNHKVYDVLEKIYKDMSNLIPWSDTFHMGGDEVFIACWNMTDEIIRYIGRRPRSTETFLDLWGEFQSEALERYDKIKGHNNSNIIMWTSELTDPVHVLKYLPSNRYVIQAWVPNTNSLPQDLIDLNYRLIISTKNAWYLDHGFWGGTPYYDWRKVYSNEILNDPQVLGGEVCMWGEYVDEHGVQSRVWPRAAAAAERLWSNPTFKTIEVEARFYRHRERLVRLGIDADAVIPKWCYYNEGQC